MKMQIRIGLMLTLATLATAHQLRAAHTSSSVQDEPSTDLPVRLPRVPFVLAGSLFEANGEDAAADVDASADAPASAPAGSPAAAPGGRTPPSHSVPGGCKDFCAGYEGCAVAYKRVSSYNRDCISYGPNGSPEGCTLSSVKGNGLGAVAVEWCSGPVSPDKIEFNRRNGECVPLNQDECPKTTGTGWQCGWNFDVGCNKLQKPGYACRGSGESLVCTKLKTQAEKDAEREAAKAAEEHGRQMEADANPEWPAVKAGLSKLSAGWKNFRRGLKQPIVLACAEALQTARSEFAQNHCSMEFHEAMEVLQKSEPYCKLVDPNFAETTTAIETEADTWCTKSSCEDEVDELANIEKNWLADKESDPANYWGPMASSRREDWDKAGCMPKLCTALSEQAALVSEAVSEYQKLDEYQYELGAAQKEALIVHELYKLMKCQQGEEK